MTEPMPAELQQAIQLLFADMTFKASGPSFYRLGMVDIKKEYRKKAMLLHPDRSELLGESCRTLEEKFKQINHAYGILKSEFQDKYFILRIKSAPRPVSVRPPAAPARESRSGFSRQAAPSQPKPGKEYFYTGSALPGRSLRLGEYLFCRQLISWETLIQAIVWQYRHRPRLGEIALDLHYLTHREIRDILKRKNPSEPFGQAAVRLGLLNDYRCLVILGRQRRYGVPLGRFFLDHGIVTEAELDRYVQENRLHNIRYYKNSHKQ
ncbi:MAG: DnaJ domain-containing protein [Desulfuromonadales bacterium]|nr:DnaJ domain-containing protein [Desulfuromonadales bacterium]